MNGATMHKDGSGPLQTDLRRFDLRRLMALVRSARGTRLALLPPSFLSSSPATVRSARTGAVKESSAGLVRPAGAAEDTALRALTAPGRGLQSR